MHRGVPQMTRLEKILAGARAGLRDGELVRYASSRRRRDGWARARDVAEVLAPSLGVRFGDSSTPTPAIRPTPSRPRRTAIFVEDDFLSASITSRSKPRSPEGDMGTRRGSARPSDADSRCGSFRHREPADRLELAQRRGRALRQSGSRAAQSASRDPALARRRRSVSGWRTVTC